MTCLLALAYANDDMLTEEQRLRSMGGRSGSSMSRSSSGLRRGRSIEEEMEAEEQRLRSMGSRGLSMGRVSSGVHRG